MTLLPAPPTDWSHSIIGHCGLTVPGDLPHSYCDYWGGGQALGGPVMGLWCAWCLNGSSRPGYTYFSSLLWQRWFLKLSLLTLGKILIISKNFGLQVFFQLQFELIPPCCLTEAIPRAGSEAERHQEHRTHPPHSSPHGLGLPNWLTQLFPRQNLHRGL